MKVRDVIKRIEADGWYLARIRGDHRHYKHPTKRGIVTVSGHLGKDMPVGTLLSTAYHKCFPSLTRLMREDKLGVGGESPCEVPNPLILLH